MTSIQDRRPQRFRYRKRPGGIWQFGACFPVEDAGTAWWWIRTLTGHASFDDDPWEVLGHVIGYVTDFEWIDHDYGWAGDVTVEADTMKGTP